MHSVSQESTASTLVDEAKSSPLVLLQEHSLELTPDGRYVRWLRDHPKHPRNWSFPRKAYDLILICVLDLFVYVWNYHHLSSYMLTLIAVRHQAPLV